MTAIAVTIAGSDSSGGAGIQADLKTFSALGVYGASVITALTAQNTLGVDAIHPIPAEMILAQIDAVVSDIGVDAVKIGMVGSAFAARQIATRLQELKNLQPDLPIVFDPVMVATSGSALADDATVKAFGRLMDVATIATTNLPELKRLTSEEDPVAAALVEGRGDGEHQVGHAHGDRHPPVLRVGHRREQRAGHRRQQEEQGPTIHQLTTDTT